MSKSIKIGTYINEFDKVKQIYARKGYINKNNDFIYVKRVPGVMFFKFNINKPEIISVPVRIEHRFKEDIVVYNELYIPASDDDVRFILEMIFTPRKREFKSFTLTAKSRQEIIGQIVVEGI